MGNKTSFPRDSHKYCVIECLLFLDFFTSDCDLCWNSTSFVYCLVKVLGYPLFLSYNVYFLVFSVKLTASELVLRSLFVSPIVMPLLVVGLCMFVESFVGFM